MSGNKIRDVEHDVLDEEYKRYAFLRLPEDLAITRLLKITGDIFRDHRGSHFKALAPISIQTFTSLLTRGLSHCLRWVCSACPPGEVVQGPRWKQEDAQALDFLDWGMKYALLATDHVAWSNSLIEATIDPGQRVIAFGTAKCMDFPYFKRQIRADLEWSNVEMNESYPLEGFVHLFNGWQQHAEWVSRCLRFSPDFVRTHARFAEMRAWTTLRLFPELAEDCSLGPYQVSHLRTFIAALYTLCECIRILEDKVDERVGLNNQMGSWTFQGSRRDIIEWLVYATGLGDGLVDSILSDMTLNANRFHCSVTATPFIQSRRNTIFLLPRSFSALSPQRSFATALTSGSGRKTYERIANDLERFHISAIATLLRGYGLNVTCEKPFITPEGRRITPDFIISDRSNSTVVVADFKNALAATAVAEVTNRIKEYNKGVVQVERYVDSFVRFPKLLDTIVSVPHRTRKIRGLLLFRVPMPLPVARNPRIEVDNWFSLQRRLRNSNKNALRHSVT